VSKNPDFDYTKFCLVGFMKTFPSLSEADPEAVALRLYEDASAFSGRERWLSAGAEDDIRCQIAAAANVELEVCAAREIKDSLRNKLRKAWITNDHALIFKVAFNFERAASMISIDLRDVEWVDPYRISEEIDDEEVVEEIPEVVREWIEVVTEPSQNKTIIGNRHRKRISKKPPTRQQKLLDFGGEV
jgi:hypothetical protein